MKIDYDGQVYDLDLAAVTLKQAMVIQGYVGMSVMKLLEQFANVEEDTPELLLAIGAIYWLMHNQAGHQFPIADADFPLTKFLEAFFTALRDENLLTLVAPEPEAGAGPTGPSPAASPSPPDPPSPEPNQTPTGQEAIPAAAPAGS